VSDSSPDPALALRPAPLRHRVEDLNPIASNSIRQDLDGRLRRCYGGSRGESRFSTPSGSGASKLLAGRIESQFKSAGVTAVIRAYTRNGLAVVMMYLNTAGWTMPRHREGNSSTPNASYDGTITAEVLRRISDCPGARCNDIVGNDDTTATVPRTSTRSYRSRTQDRRERYSTPKKVRLCGAYLVRQQDGSQVISYQIPTETLARFSRLPAFTILTAVFTVRRRVTFVRNQRRDRADPSTSRETLPRRRSSFATGVAC
jgi:hypothetical protein